MIKIHKILEEKHNNLLVVDGTNLVFSFISKTGFAIDYINTIESIANSYKADKIIVLFDWGQSSFRKSFYPEYKGDRVEKRKNQSQEESDKFTRLFDELNTAGKLLEAKGYPVIKLKGVEADDENAYIINNYSNKFDMTTMLSSDRDWNLMLKDNVQQFSYINRKEYRLDNWTEHHNLPHEQFLDYKILSGDASDCISKPEGLGPKRAEAILEEYDSVWDIPFPLDSHLKYLQNLNEFEKEGGLERNDMLMNLPEYCEEAINFTDPDNTNKIDEILGEYL